MLARGRADAGQRHGRVTAGLMTKAVARQVQKQGGGRTGPAWARPGQGRGRTEAGQEQGMRRGRGEGRGRGRARAKGNVGAEAGAEQARGHRQGQSRDRDTGRDRGRQSRDRDRGHTTGANQIRRRKSLDVAVTARVRQDKVSRVKAPTKISIIFLSKKICSGLFLLILIFGRILKRPFFGL